MGECALGVEELKGWKVDAQATYASAENPDRGEIFIEKQIYNVVEPQRGDTNCAGYATPAPPLKLRRHAEGVEMKYDIDFIL